MTKKITTLTVTISLVAGISNCFFIGLSLALSAGGPEVSQNEILGYVCFGASLLHILVSSWLFIYHKAIGHLVAIATSGLGLIGPLMILTGGFSMFWIFIAICFAFTIFIHTNNLVKTGRKPKSVPVQ